MSVCFSARYLKNRCSQDHQIWHRNVPRWVIMGIYLFWSQNVKGQGQGHETHKHCRRGSLHSCECWLLLIYYIFTSVHINHHKGILFVFISYKTGKSYGDMKPLWWVWLLFCPMHAQKTQQFNLQSKNLATGLDYLLRQRADTFPFITFTIRHISLTSTAGLFAGRNTELK